MTDDDAGGGPLRTTWRIAAFVVLTFGIAFLFQIGLAALPLGDAGAVLVVLGVGAFLLAATLSSWILMEKVEGVPLAALGLPVDRLLGRDLGRGALLGGGLIAAAVLPLAAAGWIGWRPEPGGIAPGSLLGSFLEVTSFFLAAALVEELLFRGYPFQAIARRLGGGWAIGLTSAAFACLHVLNPGLGRALLEGPSLWEILPLVNIGLAGVILGLAYWRTYNLWYATGVHLGWNWVMGFAADLPVSGLESGTTGYAFFDTPGWDVVVAGPAAWTGGGFGPEGGLAVTLASLAGIAWLTTTDRLSRSLRVRALRPLPDRRDDDADARPAAGERRGPDGARPASTRPGGGPDGGTT